MKIPHFIGQFIWQTGSQDLVDKEIVHRLKNVLKLKAGEQIFLANGKGKTALAKIVSLDNKKVSVDLLEIKENKSEEEFFLILYCAVLKKDNFEWIAQKVTEVGVTSIVPIITERSIKTKINLPRLEKIIKEAGEQSGRGVLPSVSNAITFAEAIKNSQSNEVNYFCDISGEKNIVAKNNYKKIGLFVGPEGGWTDKEILLAKQKNFKFLSLGKTTLRGETAAILGVYEILR